jgi:hypothetical protein
MPGDDPADPGLGQLVPRGQHDGLARSADAIVEGVHGRTYSVGCSDNDLDEQPGRAAADGEQVHHGTQV